MSCMKGLFLLCLLSLTLVAYSMMKNSVRPEKKWADFYCLFKKKKRNVSTHDNHDNHCTNESNGVSVQQLAIIVAFFVVQPVVGQVGIGHVAHYLTNSLMNCLNSWILMVVMMAMTVMASLLKLVFNASNYELVKIYQLQLVKSKKWGYSMK